MNTSNNLQFALAAVVAIILTEHQASALLTWELSAVAVDGGGIINGPKQVTTTASSTLVTLDLWAVVTGTNGVVDETLSSGYGMLLSSGPAPSPVTLDSAVIGNTAVLGFGQTLRGNFNVSPIPDGNLVSPWNLAATTSNGVQRDLNGDGALDIGGASSTTSNDFVLISASPGSPVGALTEGPNYHALPNGREWRVAQYTYSITSGAAGGVTGVNFGVPLMAGMLTNAARTLYNEDGGASETGRPSTNLAVGAPVIIGVPEPSAFGMLALGAVGLVGFRRFGFSRAACLPPRS